MDPTQDPETVAMTEIGAILAVLDTEACQRVIKRVAEQFDHCTLGHPIKQCGCRGSECPGWCHRHNDANTAGHYCRPEGGEWAKLTAALLLTGRRTDG